jgi:serine/threonine-protein kinase
LLEERVLEFAPATRISRAGINTAFRLGDGVLIVDNVQTAPIDCLAAFDYEPTFDVVAYSAICARKPRDRHDYEGRAHSLWFCDAHEEGVYRWYELAFMVLPSIPERSTVNPFALDPQDEYAGRAFVPVMDVRQLAWQPVPFDQGDEGPFIERWLGWFAEAADGSIAHPRYMPEESGGRHRPARQARARTSL